MPLFKDIVSCSFTDEDDTTYDFDTVSAARISRGSKRIANSSDDDRHVSLVDSSDHSASVVLYFRNPLMAVGDAGAPPVGSYGTLSITVLSADGGSNRTYTLGDNENSFARCMGGSANQKHADVDAAAALTFRGYSPDGTTEALAST